MSGLFGALSNGIKALNAQSRAIETAGRNLANVNNPNYARQRIVYGDRGTVQTPLGAQSLGLEAKQIEQMRDFLLDRQVVRENSLKSSYETQQAAYQKAQAGLGQSIDRAGETDTTGAAGSGSGISESLSDFFNSFQSFAARPTDPGEKQTLIQKAGVLTDRIQITDNRLAEVQSDLTFQASADVDDANRILSSIAELNAQIGRFEINAPGTAVDLRDQRQAQLEELSKKISFETQPDPAGSGQINVLARDGSGNPVVLVNLATVAGPLSLSGATISGGTPSTALNVTGGSIKGAIIARDTGVQDLRDNLDALASQLVTSVNAAYAPSGGTFFNAAGVTAGTISLATGLNATTLKATTPTGAAGDNNIAKAVANLANTSFSTSGGDAIDGTFSQFYSTTVANFGQTLSTTNSRVTEQTNIENLVRTQRDGVSGVSLDEEMTDLMKYQRSFQASSRVIQVIDELLDTIVNRLGVG
ncbi:flagellar hook-associated protein FlgK [Nibricoccus aquaticus]|uniref:Flagellar hook-associated protein 1 n=1 Tax=Nibricoccus aquaticus TaxID=2576891 RepID=A0A290Q6I7_9BACT|nr:flagellar hook-associated protein FlgK [Nibricoccus aquaticus]ATC64114.1 flagellar hook-associated protein FlgK [Nibricoccus aquaticus]